MAKIDIFDLITTDEKYLVLLLLFVIFEFILIKENLNLESGFRYC